MSQANLEYKTAMAALEEILTRIDDSDMGIDELASEVERATILLRECRKIFNGHREENTRHISLF